MARTLHEPDFAQALTARLLTDSTAVANEVLTTHARLVSGRTDTGAPWPRRLGTPPWAVAHALTASSGIPHSVHLVTWWNTAHRFEQLRAALDNGLAVPVYVGNHQLPRHVVLAVPATNASTASHQISVHDPATGRIATIDAAQWCSRSLRTASWPVPWLVVLPDLNHTTPATPEDSAVDQSSSPSAS